MPSVSIVLRDVVTEKGRPGVNVTLATDLEGYPGNGPPTPAVLEALTFRILGEMGILAQLRPLVKSHVDLESLQDQLRKHGLMDDQGDLDLSNVLSFTSAEAQEVDAKLYPPATQCCDHDVSHKTGSNG